MNKDNMEEIQTFWNRVARDWDLDIGEEGDSNRLLNFDKIARKQAAT